MRVRRGSRLSQMRFRVGDTRLTRRRAPGAARVETLVFDANEEVGEGVALSIDLKGDGRNGLIGFRSKRHTPVIDMDKKDALDVLDYWEPLINRGSDEFILDPDEFYILVSRESVHVPPAYAAEMVPFDPLVGEFRVHYAGFFDPGFGHSAAGGTGSRAVLEVRSREVPFLLGHGQTIGRLIYERLSRSARPALRHRPRLELPGPDAEAQQALPALRALGLSHDLARRQLDVVDEAVAPVLADLVGLDHRVPRRVEVAARVAVRRFVAAADMAADEADAQVHPSDPRAPRIRGRCR